MRLPRRALAFALLAAACCWVPAGASALPGLPGGTPAPSISIARAGGAVYAVPALGTAGARPVVTRLSVPRYAVAGAPPRVTLRLDERGVGTVYVTVSVIDLATHRRALAAPLGWSHTGRTLYVSWPAGASLPAGSYEVTVNAHDHHGTQLLRGAHSSGVASLTVGPATPPAAPMPPPQPPALGPSETGALSPAATVADGAVFPVAGPHTFGEPENRFGAAREGHIHQGQDVLTAEGTPVLAPLAGSISYTSYQAEGAGYYVVEHTTVGLDFMFAHCQAGSVAVSVAQAVAAGAQLCRAGETGDATAPHLHFEIWVGGWQAQAGHPIDPLPYLEAWERGATGT